MRKLRANRKTAVIGAAAVIAVIAVIFLIQTRASAFSIFGNTHGNYFDTTDSQVSLYRNTGADLGSGPGKSGKADKDNDRTPDFGGSANNGGFIGGFQNGFKNGGSLDDDLPGYTGGGLARGSKNSDNKGPKGFSFKEDEWKDKKDDGGWKGDDNGWRDDEDGRNIDDDWDQHNHDCGGTNRTTTATPEPMTIALLGGGLFGLAGLKRRMI